MKKAAKVPPRWATAIKERRESLGRRQEDAPDITREVLQQSTISNVETGVSNPVNWTTDRLMALLHFLQWSLDDLIKHTGLEFRFYTHAQAEAIHAAQHLEVSPQYMRFEVYAGVSAGSRNPSPLEDNAVYISIDKLRAKGVDPDAVRCYRVNGDCLVSTEARKIEKNIADGDVIAVDTRRRPRPGEAVVAWWPEGQKLVVKRYAYEEGSILLYPVRPGHPVVTLPADQDVNLIGVVFWREG